MNIDWFTVVAQIVNFLILVWLMQHFLYKPIHKAIDTREQRIEKELADADAKKAEAKIERDEFQKKNEDFDLQYTEKLSKMSDEVKAERDRRLDEVRKEADNVSDNLHEVLREDALNLKKNIHLRTQQEVFAITRKTLSDLATTSLEERLGDVFMRQLEKMDSKVKEDFKKALKNATETALLRTAFELTTDQQGTIHNAINETFEAEVDLRFVTEPELISGIEFSTDGYKIGWNIEDYLLSMEKGVNELLKVKEKPETNELEATSEEGANNNGE